MAQPKPYGGDITDKQLRSAIASENGQVACLKYYVRCEPQSIEDARHIIEEVDTVESARMAEQYQGDDALSWAGGNSRVFAAKEGDSGQPDYTSPHLGANSRTS